MTCLVLYWVKVRNPNLGLTELMYITELVNSGDVKRNDAVFLCICVSIYSHVLTVMSRGRFLCSDLPKNSVHACNQFQ